MLEPISLSAALCWGYSALAEYTHRTSAISSEAGQVVEAASRLLRDQKGSESLFGMKAMALSRLSSAVNELTIDDEQEAVPPESIQLAGEFLRALPDDLSMPNIGVDPDGAISITWVASGGRMFSVSVSDVDRLAFAWLDGSDKGYSVARFRPPLLPNILLSTLRAVISTHATSLRAA